MSLSENYLYYLKNFMGGKNDIKAFREVGLDAAITIPIAKHGES